MMRYTTLMRRVDEGTAEINAWSIQTENDPVPHADVTFYSPSGRATRKIVPVPDAPADDSAQ